MSDVQEELPTYLPLDLSRQQIRLVKFSDLRQDKGTQAEGLPMLHVKVFDMSNCPPYVGLSYVWGSPTPQYTIGVIEHKNEDGLVKYEDVIGSLNVRENLWDFLHIMHKDYCNSYFWIDQICIDQKNEKEKNHQVQFMGEIFRSASWVLAWLGNVTEVTEFTEELRIIRGKIQMPPSKFNNHDPDKIYHFPALERVPRSPFLLKSYWTRLWVIQELVLARDITVRYGEQTIRWSELPTYCKPPPLDKESISNEVLLADHFNDYHAWYLSFFEPLDRHRRSEIKAQTLYQVLTRYHEQRIVAHAWKCEKPQDQIYGLLGLVMPEERIKVDYSKSDAELRVEVWQFAMSRLINEICNKLSDPIQFKTDALSQLWRIEIMSKTLLSSLNIPKWPIEVDYKKIWEDCLSEAQLQVSVNFFEIEYWQGFHNRVVHWTL